MTYMESGEASVERAPEITAMLRKRASTRAFGEQPIDDVTVRALLEAARWAPSWGNLQPWRFIAVRDPAVRAALAAAFTRGNAWARAAPLVVVVTADPADSKARDGESYYLFDCGLATANLIVEAVARGLVAHPFGGWDEAQVRAALGIAETRRVVVLVAIGYPGSGEGLDERAREKDARPRERLPIEQIAYAERWGAPLPAIDEPPGEC